jgi:pimeloyl-ACP methyl ester carboxylesterase
MVMNDHQTGTIWQHATGATIDGALQGAQLEILPAWETTWGELRSMYPQASYAVEPEKFTGLMPKPMLQRALHITHIANMPGLSMPNTRLDAHEMVIGVAFNGQAKAYPQLWGVDFRTQATKLEVPVYFLIGRHDINAPTALVEQYFAVLDAPHKEIVWFEHSGHTPWVSESNRFVEVMVETVLAHRQP